MNLGRSLLVDKYACRITMTDSMGENFGEEGGHYQGGKSLDPHPRNSEETDKYETSRVAVK